MIGLGIFSLIVFFYDKAFTFVMELTVNGWAKFYQNLGNDGQINFDKCDLKVEV